MMQILRREPASFDLPLRLMTRRGQELLTAPERRSMRHIVYRLHFDQNLIAIAGAFFWVSNGEGQ